MDGSGLSLLERDFVHEFDTKLQSRCQDRATLLTASKTTEAPKKRGETSRATTRERERKKGAHY